MKLIIGFKNGLEQSFTDKEIDCSVWTLLGHANQIKHQMGTGNDFYTSAGNYLTLRLSEIIYVRVV